MTDKSIQERAKETLRWIQEEQKARGFGMVESNKVADQSALRFLLRKGDVFEPQKGMIKSTVEPVSEETEFADHPPWIWRTPKPKRKGETPEPYEFLAYPDWGVLPTVVADALRGMGFADGPFLFEGYSYRKIAGGALRRRMVGTHSKEELLAELKQKEQQIEENGVDFERKIDDVVAEYKGKHKQFPKVQVYPNISYYPKDGSFSFVEKDKCDNQTR